MDRLNELREIVAYLLTELRAIHAGAENRALNDDEDKRFTDGQWLMHAAIAEGIQIEDTNARGAILDAVKIPERVEPGSAPNVILDRGDPFSDDFQRTHGLDESFTRAVGEVKVIEDAAKDEILKRAAAEVSDSENMVDFKGFYMRHSSKAYCNGFFKRASGRDYALTQEEIAALEDAHRYDSMRGLSTTAANGGAMIPTFLDPSVVLTNNGTASSIREISRVESGTVNVWNGVSSAGITLAWSTEGGDSTDVAPTFLSPSVTAYKWHGTVPVTIEAFEDIANLGNTVAMMIAESRERFLAQYYATGSGSSQPYGIVGALSGLTGTARQSVHSTNSAFTVTDFQNAYLALGPRYQPNATWVSSLTYANRVRNFGTTSYADRSTTLREGVGDTLMNKPWKEVSDMTTALSTASNYAFVYGDFSNFLIYDRIGTEVEFIPLLMSPGNALPNGRRGWYCYGRAGSDSINDTGFVLSVNPAA